jgi:hypothetical protein
MTAKKMGSGVIVAGRHHDRYGLRNLLGGLRRGRCLCDNDIDLKLHQLGRERGKTVEMTICPSMQKRYVLPLHITVLAQAHSQ